MYSRDAYLKIMDSIVDLSEEYYGLVPVHGYDYERLTPLFSENDLRTQMELIHGLKHLGCASELLLGAQFRSEATNPVDYVYRSLGCRLQHLEETSSESQLILQYIYNTSKSNRGYGEKRPQIEEIYKICRDGADDEILKNEAGNHWFLFHGTKPENVLSVLASGLQVAPLSADVNGHAYGKGIYFADMFCKSRGYSQGRSTNSSKYMFVAEVSLGNVQDVKFDKSGKLEDLAPGFHSFKTPLALYRPDPSSCVYWNGRSVPLGASCPTSKEMEDWTISEFFEYVVFKSSQVCLRYLIQFSD
jgi:hypothetical protein